MEVNLPEMPQTAGFDKLVSKVDTEAVQAALPQIQTAIEDLQAAAK